MLANAGNCVIIIIISRMQSVSSGKEGNSMSGLFNNFYYGKAGKADFTPEQLPKNRVQLFFSMLRVVVGMSTEIFWLSKALIQQVSFIVVALVMCVVVIVGQWLFESSMNKNGTFMPKSFIIMTAILLVVYGVLKLIVLFY